MNSEEINFCDNCYNLTFLHLDTDNKKLYHACKNCATTKEFSGNENCIYSNTFQDYDKSMYINTNKYIIHDISLLLSNYMLKSHMVPITKDKFLLIHKYYIFHLYSFEYI